MSFGTLVLDSGSGESKQYLYCKEPTYTNAVRPYANQSHLRAIQIVPSVKPLCLYKQVLSFD